MKQVIAVLVCWILASSATAFAGAKAEAKLHVEKATALHGEGKLAEALAELTTAYALDPNPDLLYAIAQVHVQLGNCPVAITFYQRFLSSKPAAGPAGAAREAIKVCKTAPPEPMKQPEPAPEPEPVPVPEPAPAPAPVVVPREQPDAGPRAWYTDKLGGALVSGGVVLGVVSVVFYLGARGKLDDAESAATLPEHDRLVDDARGQRNLAVGLAVGSGVMIGAGVVRYMLRDSGERRRVTLTPTTDGGLVTWMGRF